MWRMNGEVDEDDPAWRITTSPCIGKRSEGEGEGDEAAAAAVVGGG